jgi:hypothetical protein
VVNERRARVRAALLRSGFNVPTEEAAMRALGEDPARFQELLEALWEEWNPAGGLQEGLVIGLARAMWLANRADRMQEGYALREAQEVNSGRQERLHARMMRFKITAERLRRLAESVAEEHYVTTPEDLEKMKTLHEEGVLKDMGEIALMLFYQLQVPGGDENGLDPYEVGRRMVAQAQAIFGIGLHHPPTPPANAAADVAPGFSPAPADLKVSATENAQLKVSATAEQDKRYPSISVAEWERRERPRQLLENILTRQVDICEEQREALLKESVKGPSPYERAAEIAPTLANSGQMRRMQDSNLRDIRRSTNLLLRIKRFEWQKEAAGKNAACHDVSQNKWDDGL